MAKKKIIPQLDLFLKEDKGIRSHIPKILPRTAKAPVPSKTKDENDEHIGDAFFDRELYRRYRR